jgi:response regulator NasT
MIFRDQTYSVLLASADEKLNSAVRSALTPGEYWPVLTVKNGGEARRFAAERDFDIILVNDVLPDESSLQLAEQLCHVSSAAVALLAKREEADDLYFRTVEQGVFLLQKPVPLAAFQHSMRLLCAACERLRRSEAKQLSVETRMAQIRLVNRAKWVLIENEGLTEPQAHRRLEKMAMDSRRTKEDVAEEIIYLDSARKKL